MESLKNTVENMNIPLWKKNRMIRKYVYLEYGVIDFKIRYSNTEKEYYDNTILMVKVSKNKYEYIDFFK